MSESEQERKLCRIKSRGFSKSIPMTRGHEKHSLIQFVDR